MTVKIWKVKIWLCVILDILIHVILGRKKYTEKEMFHKPGRLALSIGATLK